MIDITYWILACPETGARWDTYYSEADAFEDQDYWGDGVVVKVTESFESGLRVEEYLDD